LSLGGRFIGVGGSALVAFLASPGIRGEDGSLVLAVVSVALWAWTVLHPLGPRPWRARAVEWFGGALVGGLMMLWVRHVVFLGVLYIGAGWGVYFVAMGALLRRLARRFTVPFAVALVWTGVELVRALVPPPFGLGWFRLGFYSHAAVWLSGSARVVGVEGLSFVVAALGGGVASLAFERRLRWPPMTAALAPLACAALLAALVPAPRTADGPRVLLVQPGFTQERKQRDDPQENLTTSIELTREAARAVREADLVCWGESMLYAPIFTAEAVAAIRAGTAHSAPWAPAPTLANVEGWQAFEAELVQKAILGLGESSDFPRGASFAVGTECLDLVDGELRRKVALVLYDAKGRRAPPAFKQYLVPLGETFFGLERFAWVRDFAQAAAGYLPDLVPGHETGRLPLESRGQHWNLGATVCFDNAHPWPFLDGMRGQPVDFHLVVSNEAWYETSSEMDQMIAFSRVFALMTGRSIVRATNSGVSAVLGPDGRELGRVRDASGNDRAVPGFGVWTVPVPAPGEGTPPPYVAWFRLSEGLWILLLVLATALAGWARSRAK
jgi:apolipoprotein N-acyltransferase